MTAPRILVWSQHFWPESFRINEVARDLAAAGAEVTVLTGQPNYPKGEIFDGYRAAGMGVEDWDGIPIVRVPLAPRGAGRSRQLAANYLSFIASGSLIAPWLLRGRRFDAVFVYGTSPILQGIPAWIVARLKGARLVLWVQDLWPESLEVTGHVSNPRILGAVRGVVGWLYRRADLILGQSEAFVTAIRPMAGKTPVAYHPNPADAPAEGGHGHDFPPGFNIVFAGNLGTVQALEVVTAAAALLRDRPDIHITLFGSGSRDAWLAETIAQQGLANVRWAGRRPPADMPAIFAQADALLVTLNRSEILAQTVPSKVQSYLGAGKPVIAALDGEGARIVSEAGAGLAVPAEDPAGLADAIRRLADMSAADRAALGDAGRRYFAAHFEPAMLAKRLLALLTAAA